MESFIYLYNWRFVVTDYVGGLHGQDQLRSTNYTFLLHYRHIQHSVDFARIVFVDECVAKLRIQLLVDAVGIAGSGVHYFVDDSHILRSAELCEGGESARIQ